MCHAAREPVTDTAKYARSLIHFIRPCVPTNIDPRTSPQGFPSYGTDMALPYRVPRPSAPPPLRRKAPEVAFDPSIC